MHDAKRFLVAAIITGALAAPALADAQAAPAQPGDAALIQKINQAYDTPFKRPGTAQAAAQPAAGKAT
jgi:hypothetical protein